MNRLLARPGQYLSDHLRQVAEKAKGFAEYFGGESYAELAGLLHDIGKAEAHFQQRIRNGDSDSKAEKKPHCHHGAAFLLNREPIQWPVAIAINGHHAGLHNRGDVDKHRNRCKNAAAECETMLRSDSPDFAVSVPDKTLPDWLQPLAFLPNHRGEGWLATDLFTRFLFSALIDADRLDTEEHTIGQNLSQRARTWEPFNPQELLSVLENRLQAKADDARKHGRSSDDVLTVRRNVGRYCRDAAKKDHGLFSLMVPTGGGKTLASMLFALHHAVHHNKNAPDHQKIRRLVVVIPYLSIIQQTVKEFRDTFETTERYKGKLILEHHSQAEDEPDPKKCEKTDGEYDEVSERRRLAAENWDAPIVVTTSIQFFESLFSRRPAKARKLHNIAQSIVIFDEIQTLPPLMMQPILSVIGELANPLRPYGCSFVFCTATQPALGRTDDLLTGLENIRPIVPLDDAKRHFRQLDRVQYRWPKDGETTTWEEVAASVLQQPHQQGLIVVNTRKAARDLHNAFAEKMDGNMDGLFHLSTWMMPAHRDEVLKEVKRRLALDGNGDGRQRCILVSTQCIEAGVDVDFPSVWRAFGPYDSIVQAAGRCNRNGLMDRKDAVVRIFYPADGSTPQGLYSTAISQTELLRKMGLAIPEDPESFRAYFRLLYQLSVPDECGIQQARSRLHFEEVDSMFKFIDRNTVSVLIRNQYIGDKLQGTPGGQKYDDAQSRWRGKNKRSGYFTREDWREIQPFIINLPFHLTRNKDVNSRLEKAFNDESAGLYVWNGQYHGGLLGTGIDFEGPMPQEELVI